MRRVDQSSLEVDTSGKLQAASSAHTIHTPLSAAKRARYYAEAAIRRRAAVIAGWIGELRRVAQLEGIEPELPRGFTEDREASEDGDVVLDVTWSPELVPSRGAHANILRCATRRWTSTGSGERSWIKPMVGRAYGVGYTVDTCQVSGLLRSWSVEVRAIRRDCKWLA